MKWRDRFDAMIDELNAHPDLEVREATIEDGASDDEIAAAAEQYGHAIPDEIADFYRQMNGAKVRWSHTDDRWRKLGASGSIYLFDVETTFRTDWEEDSYGGKSWRPFDWPVDEYYAGFDLREPGMVCWVYDTANDGRPFGGTFEEYLEALLQTRGFEYWQEMFGYDAERASRLGATVQESEGRMQALLPRLFDDVDFDRVGRAGDLEPADVSMLDEGPAVIGYRLDELPAELTEMIPADGDPRDCLFWVANGRESTDGLFSDLPEPNIGHVNEGLKVAGGVTFALSQTHRLAELLRPEEVPPGGRLYGGSNLVAGFHTGDAAEVESWFAEKGVRVLPVAPLLERLYFLQVEAPDGTPVRELEKASLTVNAGIRRSLREALPGIYVVEAGTREHERFELFAGDAQVELSADDLEPGAVTRVQLEAG